MIWKLLRPGNLLWLFAALISAGILHIVAVFAAANWVTPPTLPVENAGSVNTMTVLPAVSAATQVLPFQSGDQRMAVCPFDLADGPVTVRARFGEGLWTVVVLDRAGNVLYSVTNTELQRADAVLVLARTSEVRAASLPISRQAAETNITVNLPSTKGVAWIQGPVLGVSYEAETERILAGASCEPVARPDAPPPTPAP